MASRVKCCRFRWSPRHAVVFRLTPIHPSKLALVVQCEEWIWMERKFTQALEATNRPDRARPHGQSDIPIMKRIRSMLGALISLINTHDMQLSDPVARGPVCRAQALTVWPPHGYKDLLHGSAQY